ncbi:hypothetical protein OAF93_00490 [Planctomycetota bacterium]|nr:hypothetical protein [Planctomycetota bacterium]
MAYAAALIPRVVVVTRPTELEQLLGRHGTRQQAQFFLESRGRSILEADERQRALDHASQCVSQAVPADWRRASVGRRDLDRFLFEPDDVIVAIGQDGLVANVAKYLDGQPVIGIDPEPGRNAGVLVRHEAASLADHLADLTANRGEVEHRTMVAATLQNGATLLALNEIFIGHRSHQSARYRLHLDGRLEPQSSSGLIVATGTGATGWASSIARERRWRPELPAPTDPQLAWFVREAWDSPATRISRTSGAVEPGVPLRIESEMDDGVVFGDGIESDFLSLPWGQPVEVGIADRVLRLVGGPGPEAQPLEDLQSMGRRRDWLRRRARARQDRVGPR